MQWLISATVPHRQASMHLRITPNSSLALLAFSRCADSVFIFLCFCFISRDLQVKQKCKLKQRNISRKPTHFSQAFISLSLTPLLFWYRAPRWMRGNSDNKNNNRFTCQRISSSSSTSSERIFFFRLQLLSYEWVFGYGFGSLELACLQIKAGIINDFVGGLRETGKSFSTIGRAGLNIEWPMRGRFHDNHL